MLNTFCQPLVLPAAPHAKICLRGIALDLEFLSDSVPIYSDSNYGARREDPHSVAQSDKLDEICSMSSISHHCQCNFQSQYIEYIYLSMLIPFHLAISCSVFSSTPYSPQYTFLPHILPPIIQVSRNTNNNGGHSAKSDFLLSGFAQREKWKILFSCSLKSAIFLAPMKNKSIPRCGVALQ